MPEAHDGSLCANNAGLFVERIFFNLRVCEETTPYSLQVSCDYDGSNCLCS